MRYHVRRPGKSGRVKLKRLKREKTAGIRELTSDDGDEAAVGKLRATAEFGREHAEVMGFSKPRL